MNLYQISVTLLFPCFFNTFSAANGNPTHLTDDHSINCGCAGTSAARGGRDWVGDVRQKSSPLQIKGYSTASTVIHKLLAADDPIPFQTARLSRSQFSYAFQLNPGQKIVRLHFNPTQYKGFERLNDLFSVEAGDFTLLSNFSATLTAYALGLNSFVKEYCLNVEENEEFSIVFSSDRSQSSNTYAFVNGIEIFSVPPSVSYLNGGDAGVPVVGKSLVYVENTAALEMIQRQDITRDSVSLDGNIRDLFGMWGALPGRKAIHNLTWRTSVDVGFRYLVRLHFSNLVFKIAENGGLTFEFRINGIIVTNSVDNIRKMRDENSIPLYRDYMVMMQGRKEKGKRDLLIHLISDVEVMDGQGPVKGFEIMKLSNLENSLAGPNPLPAVQGSSYPTIQNSHAKSMNSSISITLFALVILVVYKLLRSRVSSNPDVENLPFADPEVEIIPSVEAQLLCRQFSLAEIRSATRNFSEAYLIGKGGFGNVYKGLIDNGGETVAIKRRKPDSRQGAREFLTEIETVSELQHDNIVSLVGYCNERGEMILVYEYMARGTLAGLLYKCSSNSDNCSSLTWKQRLEICIEAGRGLDYLHTTDKPLIHRDIKPSNILLDECLVAKVSDFGLAKQLSRSQLQSHVITEVKGTNWYRDPAYAASGILTRKSDTYAFGVVLLEVLSGRPAFDPLAAEDERVLIGWARENISDEHYERIVAQNLRGGISEDSLLVFVGIAERCLLGDPEKRPAMSQVVLELKFALELQEGSDSISSAPNAVTVDDIHSSKGSTF